MSVNFGLTVRPNAIDYGARNASNIQQAIIDEARAAAADPASQIYAPSPHSFTLGPMAVVLHALGNVAQKLQAGKLPDISPRLTPRETKQLLD
jgi:hypothetical protein